MWRSLNTEPNIPLESKKMTSRRSSAVSDVSAEDTEIQPNLVGVADSPPPAPDRGSRFLRPDVKLKGANSKKIKQAGGLLRFPEEKPALRPFFEKPKSSGIAEFYLNPPSILRSGKAAGLS